MLVSSLIKHLDHKNVTKQQGLQVNMVNVATCLVLHAKQQASGAMTAVIADLIKHLRKCLQNAAESDLSADETKQNSDLQRALEICIAELSNKVSWTGFCSFDLILSTSIACIVLCIICINTPDITNLSTVEHSFFKCTRSSNYMICLYENIGL